MLTRVSTPPTPRAVTTASIARALRREIARHNRQVLLIAAFTLLVAVLLWALLYAVCCWLLLFAVTLTEGPWKGIPPGFSVLFAVVALCALACAWIDSRLNLNALPRDDKMPAEIAADFLLALPRITLAIWGTLRAWLRLNRSERTQAAEFLLRLQRERRVAIHSVPLDIPGEARRFRILFALQIIRAIEMRRQGSETQIILDSRHPRSLFAA